MRMYQEDTKRNNWSMRRSQEDNSPSEKSVRRFGIIVWRVHQVGRSGRQAITYRTKYRESAGWIPTKAYDRVTGSRLVSSYSQVALV